MSERERWEEWSPEYAPHVRGRYTERVWDPVLRAHEEQRVEARCEVCGQEWKGWCTSGHVRDKVATFARLHLHRDPLEAPRVERPGSLRRKKEDGGG